MAQPVWITPAGNLGTIAEGLFFQQSIVAEDPEGGNVTYQLIAGSLPTGIQVKSNGIIEGIPDATATVKGVPTPVAENVTSTFAVRATSTNGSGTARINDRTFELTVTGPDIPEFITPAGRVGTFYDGEQVSIQIEFTDDDPGDVVTLSVDSGELPPGLTISQTGNITGYIEPVVPLSDTAVVGYDNNTFDEFPFSFNSRSISKNYPFTLKITDGKDQNIRTFEIYVYSNDALSADTTQITSDDTFVTSDAVTTRPPIITTPEGSIGKYRADNYFVYKFDSVDFNDRDVEIFKSAGSFPTGLQLDSTTGYLYGYLPDLGAVELNFEFSIRVREIVELAIAWDASTEYLADQVVSYQGNNYQALQDLDAGILPTFTAYWYLLDIPTSKTYNYSMEVIGEIEDAVTWLNGTLVPDRPITDPIYSLGDIDTGAISILGIEASTPGNRILQFRLKSGGVYNKLPQGLTLLPTGEIVGRATFNTFSLDGGTTTFDQNRATRLEVDPTTFDQQFDFTVEAYTSDGLISVFRTFRIFLNRSYNTPYESLYIQAMPPQEDRDLIKSVLQNQDVIPPSILYRKEDPYFGVASDVKYVQAFSLDSATLDEYVLALNLNHFRKRLILGPIKTAQALDADDNVVYEVVYSEIVDTGVNQLGESPPQSVSTAYPITVNGVETSTVYPNSLINMRDQIIDTVGQTNTVLPLWMTSKQADGKVLGFTRAWVIAYTLPGESNKCAYNINQTFPNTLNTIDFDVDRYILDRSMTKNWIPNEDSTDGGSWLEAKQTTFDVDDAPDITIFDEDSLRFTSPVDNYEFTDEYNKYLVFPKTNILG